MALETTPDAGALDQGTEPSGVLGVAGEGEEVTRLRSENTRLRQNLAENEKLSTRAVPLVRLAQALIGAPGGQEIVEKLEKGEPLTKAEEKKATAAAAESDKPLTKAEAKELFSELHKESVKEFGESVAADRKADESLKALDERAEKELEGYKDLRRDPQFQGWINATLEQIRAKTIVLPEGEDDLWWFAVKTAHRIAHAVAGKPSKKPKGDTERVAEALAAGGAKPSSTSSGGSDYPEEMREQIERIRGYGNPMIAGKSFGNPQAK